MSPPPLGISSNTCVHSTFWIIVAEQGEEEEEEEERRVGKGGGEGEGWGGG